MHKNKIQAGVAVCTPKQSTYLNPTLRRFRRRKGRAWGTDLIAPTWRSWFIGHDRNSARSRKLVEIRPQLTRSTRKQTPPIDDCRATFHPTLVKPRRFARPITRKHKSRGVLLARKRPLGATTTKSYPHRYQRGVIRIRGPTLSNPVCRKNDHGQIPMESKCDIPLTTTSRQSNKFIRDSLSSNHAASQLHKMPVHYQYPVRKGCYPDLDRRGPSPSRKRVRHHAIYPRITVEACSLARKHPLGETTIGAKWSANRALPSAIPRSEAASPPLERGRHLVRR